MGRRGGLRRWVDPREDWAGFVTACRERLIDEGGGATETERREAARQVCSALLEPAGLQGAIHAAVAEATIAEVAGYSVLEPLMARDDVTEIMVRGADPIWIETSGRLEETPFRFTDPAALRSVIERMLLASGRRVDESSPIVDARLADGSRLNVVLPPVAPAPTMTLRRFAGRRLDMERLVTLGMFTARMAAFVHAVVIGRANVLVTGATGSGKTTLLGAICDMVPPGERIVTVEEVAELRLDHPNVGSQECRPAGTDGVAEIDLRRLVRNSLRMRPDRIVVGEVRGPEVVEMLQALNTGHCGSMTTLHANSCSDAMVRLETLVTLGISGIGAAVAQRWIATALDIVIHCERGRDGVRRVVEIAALDTDRERITITPIFTRTSHDGTVRTTGAIPYRCLHRMEDNGVVFPQSLLRTGMAA